MQTIFKDQHLIQSTSRLFAIRAVARLTRIQPNESLYLDDLCGTIDLPRSSISHVLQNLVRRGLLMRTGTAGRGFALARQSSEVSIHDIMRALDGVDDLG